MAPAPIWTPREDAIIIAHPGMTCAELVRYFPGRTEESIYKRRRKIGASRGKTTVLWAPEEDAILHQNTSTYAEDLIPLLRGRSKFAIQNRRRFLDLLRPERGHNDKTPKRPKAQRVSKQHERAQEHPWAPVAYIAWKKTCDAIHERPDGTVFRCGKPTVLRRGLCVACVAHFNRMARAA